mmetsp:Transcript_24634/g.28183  ORF Transcript_24634/g.28183 Transcript_24634/m.28183 type:complete len:366 (+) Transcript_24634:132-1229(+)
MKLITNYFIFLQTLQVAPLLLIHLTGPKPVRAFTFTPFSCVSSAPPSFIPRTQASRKHIHQVVTTSAHNRKISTTSLTKTTLYSSNDSNNQEKSSIDVMMGKVNIPDEYKQEILQAEANTPAAKDRQTRSAIYASSALIGILISSFNGFLTTIRGGEADLSVVNEVGFGWVSENPLTSFLFLSKFGGGIALLVAGLTGTLLELEQRTKNENAEKIWQEFQRRKAKAESGGKKKKRTGSKRTKESKISNKSRKNRKRLNALSEVVADTNSNDKSDISSSSPGVYNESSSSGETSAATKKNDDTGVDFFGKVKDFYDQADQMAQSQALLLNKELEDRGVLEKITDDTGLKVIGKEQAAAKKKNDNNV